MIFHLLYRIGRYLALKLPLKISYRIAVFLADMHYFLYKKERQAVIENLKVVLNDSSQNHELKIIARDVFRNFAKYLVDFFRFSKIDSEYIKRFIKLEGLSNIEEALKHGKGVIILSAHIGNWELGGFVMGTLGYPISAVVLTHQNKNINEFFLRQRSLGKMKSIEFGASLRCCYNSLKNNELLALLGDRDFSKNGIPADFFGHTALLPKGPPVLSYRTGAAIVPSFMLRNPDDTYAFVFEKPILPDPLADEKSNVNELMKKYLSVVESYIRKYPGQWYVFRELWNNYDKDLRPDSVV